MSGKVKLTEKGKLVVSYLEQYPEWPTMTIAKAIWNTNEGKLLFSGLEAVRASCRYFRNESGDGFRKRPNKTTIPTTKQTMLDSLKAVEVDTLDFDIEYILPPAYKKILLLADIHVPYHDSNALVAALEFAKDKDIDCVLLNGDFMDFPEISRYERDLAKADLQYAFDAGVRVLEVIRECFPKAKIFYKVGNHDDRLDKFVMLKAPQLKGLRGLTIDNNLNFNDFGITKIGSLQKIMVDDFIILHGHELRQSIMAPVNPARGLYMKAQASSLMSHCHRTSSHTERPINGKSVRTYSTGCLCNLRAEYDPHNKWNHGFAIIERSNGVRVNNYTIENGIIE